MFSGYDFTGGRIYHFLLIFGRPFVKRFAYAIGPLSYVCPLYDVGALWPNG